MEGRTRINKRKPPERLAYRVDFNREYVSDEPVKGEIDIMATTAESKAAPKRVRRTTKKTTLVEEAPAVVVEAEVVQQRRAPQTVSFHMAAPQRRGGVRYKDVTAFLRQLIMLLEAGTPILRSLQTLSTRGERPAARALVADIAAYVEMGNPLWQSFDRHPRYFDTIFVNLIRASEASGTLTTVLKRVADYREHRAILAKRIQGAMVYPVILVAACLGVMLLITKWVVPEFESMFKSSNIAIPIYTQYFFKVSHFVSGWWWTPVLGFLALVAVYLGWFVRSPIRRLWADRQKLRIPIAGPILHKNAIVELTKTMSLLLRSGLSMMTTLELTRNAVRNRAVAECLRSVRSSIEEGGGMEEPLRQSAPVIPHVVTDMFVTGEESGRVDVVADQIGDVYEEEVQIAVGAIGEAIQPIFTVLVGAVVAILFASLFGPIVSMVSQLTSAGV